MGDLPLVQCYLGEINQVVLNLLVNAAHAIGNKHGGTIRFETGGKGTTFFVRLPIEGRVGAGAPPIKAVA